MYSRKYHFIYTCDVGMPSLSMSSLSSLLAYIGQCSNGTPTPPHKCTAVHCIDGRMIHALQPVVHARARHLQRPWSTEPSLQRRRVCYQETRNPTSLPPFKSPSAVHFQKQGWTVGYSQHATQDATLAAGGSQPTQNCKTDTHRQGLRGSENRRTPGSRVQMGWCVLRTILRPSHQVS